MNRRTFIATSAATTSLAFFAGCSDDSGSSDGESSGTEAGDGASGETETPGQTETATATATQTDADTETQAQTQTATETSQTTTVPIGERVDGEKLSMVVRSIETTDQIGEFQQAGDGNTFAVVRLAVKNTTESEFINFSGFLQTQVKDDEDYAYDQTVAATGQTFEGGQLAPGEVSRGDLVYEVPDDASGLELQFDFQAFSVFDFERVVVDLTSEASSIADLEQDLQVDVNDVGDEVTRGDVAVAVNEVSFETSLGQFTEADEGKEFAIVDITTTNDTDEELQLSTLLQMRSKSGDGTPYELSLSALSSLDQSYDESQPLAPGETRRGKVAYQVDKGVSPLYWTFEFTLWVDGDKTFWQLR